MSKPLTFIEPVVSNARALLVRACTVAELRSAQAVLLAVDHGFSRKQIAVALGVSEATVGRIMSDARGAATPSNDPPVASRKWGGRRRELLTFAEEEAFLQPWEELSKTAGMIIVGPLREAFAKKLGRPVRASVVYRLLRRHKWRKVTPDTRHPKSDEVAQEAWKKNSKKRWMKHL